MDIMMLLSWLGFVLAVFGLVSVIAGFMVVLPGATWFMIGVVLRMVIDVMAASP